MNAATPLDLTSYWMPFTHNRYFKQRPKLAASGAGAYLTLTDGRRVFDCLSGLWCTPLGHSHPEIVAAIQRQVATLDYAPGFQLSHPGAFELASRITRWAPPGLNRVFFTNSGSESVDTALKIAVAYHGLRGDAKRTKLIGRERGYHGVGIGGISVGGIQNNRTMFAPLLLPNVDHLPHTYNPAEMRFSKGQPAWGAHLADELNTIVERHGPERCMAISVAVAVGDEVADRLIESLAPKIQALRIGAPEDPATEMGPLVTQAHLNKVRDYIATGVGEGATLVVDGREVAFPGAEATVRSADPPSLRGSGLASPSSKAGGFFLGGSLFDHVRTDMRIYREEIFGPVLAIVRVPTMAAAIELINSHPYANGTAVFTRTGETARSFASAIEVGMVGVNVPLPVPMAFYSFGGWRSSLFGDHHIHGMEGVRFYTKLKCVTQRWPTTTGRAKAEFTMPVMNRSPQ
jgi:hypothetical protein